MDISRLKIFLESCEKIAQGSLLSAIHGARRLRRYGERGLETFRFEGVVGHLGSSMLGFQGMLH